MAEHHPHVYDETALAVRPDAAINGLDLQRRLGAGQHGGFGTHLQ
jgi:hypothetical protein